MAQIQLTTNAKTAYLNALVGKSTTLATFLMSGSNYNFRDAALNSLFNSAVTWGSVTAGTATLLQTITPSGSGTVDNVLINVSTPVCSSAPVGLTGLGKNIIVPTLTFSAGTPITISSVFKYPANNGGTVNINQQLQSAMATMILFGGTTPQVMAGGVLTVYAGIQPATADMGTNNTHTALVSYTMAVADYGTAASGVIALTGTKNATATGAGVPTWARLVKGAYVMDFSAGVSGTDLTLSSANINVSDTVGLVGATLTYP